MSNDVFDLKILTEKLSKLNNSQQSIESLSRWCVSHRKRARPIVETWEKMFNSSQKEQCISFLYLANDILQNSRRKGNEFVNEFWKVLPAALKHVYEKGDESGKKAATRLVDIWEERKVFGSRVQSLKDELATNEIKDPTTQAVSNGLSVNPIKIVKKDAQSLRIKMSVGGFPEKIVSAFHSLYEECSNEESALVQCDAAAISVERIADEVGNAISQGKQPGMGMVDEMQEQESVLQQCVSQLEGAEATRVALVSLLRDALQDQEAKLGTVRDHLQVACCRINEVGTLRPKLSLHNHAVPVIPVGALTEPLMMGELKSAVQGTSNLQIPPSLPAAAETVPVHQILQNPTQPATSFTSIGATDEESKKAAAAAVAAKLAASTSSAQMLSSVLSSLVAEEAASRNDSLRKVGFASSLPMFPSEKRQKLEQSSSGADVTNPEAGSSSFYASLQQPIPSNSVSQGGVQSSMAPPLPPPPPPPLSSNPASKQFVQSAGMMLNMTPYGFGGNCLPPLPPPSHLAMGPPAQHNSQPLQPPLLLSQQRNASGGYYRPPGIGRYGSSNQPSTPPVQRE